MLLIFGFLCGFFFFNIYLRCLKISSEGAGYRYSIVYKITFILVISQSIVSSSSCFKLLEITYDVLFQGPKVASCTRHRKYVHQMGDRYMYICMILCEGDKVRESSFYRQLQRFKNMSSINFNPFDTHAHQTVHREVKLLLSN